MRKQRLAGDRVQHLGKVRSHPRAGPGSEHDDVHLFLVFQAVTVVFRNFLGDLSTRVRGLSVTVVAGCLLATACSYIRLGYETMPTLALWHLDSHLSLDSAQKDLASHRIDKLVAWHRHAEVPTYAELLRGVRQQIGHGPVTEEDVQRWRDEVTGRWQPIAEQ
ncbi:MAG TPA: DUF6279 family lipoprotein, partial [Burkholderiaceae bacterium]|nr:DUF6279 family lipoprotein [Burkholderiaceae bacterium]